MDKMDKAMRDEQEYEAIKESVLKGDPTYVGDRINHCGDGSAVLIKTTDNGRESYSYFCDLDVSPGKLALYSKLFRVDVQTQVKTYGDTELLTVSIPMNRHDTPENLINVLLMELQECPHSEIPI